MVTHTEMQIPSEHWNFVIYLHLSVSDCFDSTVTNVGSLLRQSDQLFCYSQQARVIPFGATLNACCIESDCIRQHNKYASFIWKESIDHDWLNIRTCIDVHTDPPTCRHQVYLPGCAVLGLRHRGTWVQHGRSCQRAVLQWPHRPSARRL